MTGYRPFALLPGVKAPTWLLPAKPMRLLVLFGILLAILGGERIYRRWQPTHTQETEHYHLQSSAQPEQTRETGQRMEILYAAYITVFRDLPAPQPTNSKLKVKLYRDQQEFKRCNRAGWAEAYYRWPYCHAYFSAQEINPHHWMLHEGVHQLNREVAQLRLAQWAEEGLATYFSTSQLRDKQLQLGQVDRNTYPVWWLDELPLSGDLQLDLTNGTIIPIQSILTGRGGPAMNKQFNLYYLHWWSLVHLLFEGNDGQYRKGMMKALSEGASLVSIEKHIMPVEQLQTEWYEHLRQLQWDLFRVGQPGTNHSNPRSVNSSSSNPR